MTRLSCRLESAPGSHAPCGTIVIGTGMTRAYIGLRPHHLRGLGRLRGLEAFEYLLSGANPVERSGDVAVVVDDLPKRFGILVVRDVLDGSRQPGHTIPGQLHLDEERLALGDDDLLRVVDGLVGRMERVAHIGHQGHGFGPGSHGLGGGGGHRRYGWSRSRAANRCSMSSRRFRISDSWCVIGRTSNP